MASALPVFTGPEAEVEANGDQVGDVVVYGVGGVICLGKYGLHDYQGGGFLSSDRGVLNPICLELPCEALVDPGVCLGVSRFSGIGQTIQEVGCCNLPPMPEKPIISQVGPSGAWSSWCAGLGGH